MREELRAANQGEDQEFVEESAWRGAGRTAAETNNAGPQVSRDWSMRSEKPAEVKEVKET